MYRRQLKWYLETLWFCRRNLQLLSTIVLPYLCSQRLSKTQALASNVPWIPDSWNLRPLAMDRLKAPCVGWTVFGSLRVVRPASYVHVHRRLVRAVTMSNFNAVLLSLLSDCLRAIVPP